MRRRVKGKMKKKITALVLSLSLLFVNTALPVYALANTDTEPKVQDVQENLINISSSEDLKKLAKEATTETLTLNKTYFLTADIDLSDVDFKPIPVFSGTFDGKGYKIKGLNINEKSSGAGLISVLGSHGMIKDLQVEGNISPEGSKTLVGGVVGTNKGIIDNVSFAGIVKAYKKVGGVAGVNEENGFIINSRNYASVDGTKLVGGICGFNEGSVIGSENCGRIAGNNESVLPDEDKTKSVPDVNVKNLVADSEKPEMIGGIAGASSGYIKDSINSEKVGYKHTSYKVGGIVGLQNGSVLNCVNEAPVYGRKDVGGIVGVLEPYMEVSYEGDTLDKLERQTEVLSKLLDAFEAEVDKNAQALENDADNINKKRSELGDSIQDRKDFHKDEIDKFDNGLEEKNDEVRTAADKVNSNVSDIADNIGDMRHGADYSDIINNRNTKLENIISAIKNISEISGRMKADLENKKGHADNIARDFDSLSSDINELYSKSINLLDYLDEQKKDLKGNLDDSLDEINGEKEELIAQIDKARDDLKSGRQNVKSSIDEVKSELDNIRLSINEGGDRLRDKLEDEKIYFDVSENPPKEYAYGRLENSVNKAQISGDINTAGIVARIGIDPEDGIITEKSLKSKVVESGTRSLNFSNNVYALVKSNINEGNVKVKNDYAGGIAARAEYGALISNQNYADVISENGSYIGGIAGYSENLVKDSYVLGDVKGLDYIGGIVGVGKEIKGNTAMSTVISSEFGRVGSIAGDTLDAAYVSANRYVDEGIGAINDISLEGEAFVTDYEALAADENTPEGFKSLKVNYFVGDELIKSVSVPYNSYVSGADIPNAPEKEGYNTYWEYKDTGNVKRNINIHLIEEKWNKNIAAFEKVGEKPVLLASALFYEGTSLKVEETDIKGLEKGVIKAYKYSVIPDGRRRESGIELRVLNEDLKADTVALKTENGLKKLETKKVGSYLSFKVDKAQGEFVLMKTSSLNPVLILLICLVVSSLGFAAFAYRKRKIKS